MTKQFSVDTAKSPLRIIRRQISAERQVPVAVEFCNHTFPSKTADFTTTHHPWLGSASIPCAALGFDAFTMTVIISFFYLHGHLVVMKPT